VFNINDKSIREEILKELEAILELHDQAMCNYEKCREFSERLSDLLVRLEDMGYYREADRLMDALGNCSPKVASHCEKAQFVHEKMKEITKGARIAGYFKYI